MNKSEMAEKLAKKCDISQSKALECVNTIFDTKPGHGIIAVELDAARKVQIGGFGTFDTKNRSARMGRNPATGCDDPDRGEEVRHLQGRQGPQGSRSRLSSSSVR